MHGVSNEKLKSRSGKKNRRTSTACQMQWKINTEERCPPNCGTLQPLQGGAGFCSCSYSSTLIITHDHDHIRPSMPVSKHTPVLLTPECRPAVLFPEVVERAVQDQIAAESTFQRRDSCSCCCCPATATPLLPPCVGHPLSVTTVRLPPAAWLTS